MISTWKFLFMVMINFGLISIQAHNQMVDKAVPSKMNEENGVRKNFQNLFNSMAKNDAKKTEIYQRILNQEVAKERDIFGLMKEEVQIAQIRNAYKRRNLYRISVTVAKRETNESSFSAKVKQFDVGDLSPCNYLYIQIKDQMPFMMNYPKDEETKEMKDDICIGIMKSEWMVHKRELEVMEQQGQPLYEELKKNYPNIYAEYSSEVGRDNRYRIQNITAFNDESLEHNSDEMERYELQELVFSCLARNRKSKNIEQYFISQEYDLGKCKMRNLMAVPLRFVFTFKEKRGIYPVAFTDDQLDNYRLDPEK